MGIVICELFVALANVPSKCIIPSVRPESTDIGALSLVKATNLFLKA